MDRNPNKTAIRNMRRLERLGENPVCVICGYSSPFALIPVRRSLLEQHHVAVKAHDAELVATLCRNCHAEITEQLLREGLNPHFEPNKIVRISLILTALAVFIEMLAPALRRWAKSLMEAAK
jgi:hypothetical protein